MRIRLLLRNRYNKIQRKQVMNMGCNKRICEEILGHRSFSGACSNSSMALYKVNRYSNSEIYA